MYFVKGRHLLKLNVVFMVLFLREGLTMGLENNCAFLPLCFCICSLRIAAAELIDGSPHCLQSTYFIFIFSST